jgi:hypothetical protein
MGAHLVGLTDGLEARLGLGLGRRRVLVGVPFLDEVLVRGADFLRRGVLGDVEDLVVQLGRVPHRKMTPLLRPWRRGKQREPSWEGGEKRVWWVASGERRERVRLESGNRVSERVALCRVVYLNQFYREKNNGGRETGRGFLQLWMAVTVKWRVRVLVQWGHEGHEGELLAMDMDKV